MMSNDGKWSKGPPPKNKNSEKTYTEMRRLFLISFVSMLCLCSLQAQTDFKPFAFKYYMRLMVWGAKGQSIDDYRKHAKNMGLDLIYHKEEKSEIYLVWAQNVTYEKGHMTESYTKTGEPTRLLNMDLTPNSGRDKYTPITITLAFPSQQAQEQFKRDGLAYGCLPNEKIDDTDIDATWTNVSGIRYNRAPGKLKTWHYIFFYQKDGMYMCTFLF